jgi:hypothetical protein
MPWPDPSAIFVFPRLAPPLFSSALPLPHSFLAAELLPSCPTSRRRAPLLPRPGSRPSRRCPPHITGAELLRVAHTTRAP